jgi:hypothetical protein
VEVLDTVRLLGQQQDPMFAAVYIVSAVIVGGVSHFIRWGWSICLAIALVAAGIAGNTWKWIPRSSGWREILSLLGAGVFWYSGISTIIFAAAFCFGRFGLSLFLRDTPSSRRGG